MEEGEGILLGTGFPPQSTSRSSATSGASTGASRGPDSWDGRARHRASWRPEPHFRGGQVHPARIAEEGAPKMVCGPSSGSLNRPAGAQVEAQTGVRGTDAE